MSALLVLLILISMAAIVWSACFLGCDGGFPGNISNYYQYQSTVTGTPGLVAFWPLNDTSGTVAVDLGLNHFNGTYTMGPLVPTYNAAQQSDASPGTFALDQSNIVAGDTVNGNPDDPNPCVSFNGGYVSVPWQAALGPPTLAQFTLEAWVLPNWTLADAQANPSFRTIVASDAGSPGMFAGFALFASPDNLWSASIGIGSQNATATTKSNQTIVQGSTYFLVVTYDGSTLTLWVNPADTTQPPDGTAAASGYVPVASPVPLYIGTGRPDLPTPLFPFNGSIQDVAFYNVVLDGKTIETHFLNGAGLQVA
jgi:Concanavalin A-like lectin/glucanases superfamily